MPDKKKNTVCPVCGGTRKKELWRSSYVLLLSCGDCGSNYQKRFHQVPKKYDASYFESNHRKTYGKTYIEDEKNIRNFSSRRLKLLAGLRGGAGQLLDIGSALGTFCDEARKNGFPAEGLEVSRFARNFAKKYYGVKSYPGLKMLAKKKYDIVTMWFTLEHMEIPDEWIAGIGTVLKPGGILALSVPNGRGAYATFNPPRYFIARPAEHYFEPSIRGMKKLLKQHGYTIERTEIFGLHPERIGLPPFGFIKQMLKFLKWGDTFEIYARRK